METLFVLGGVLAGAALILLLWRAVRFVMRIVLVAVLVLLLAAGALLWWFGRDALSEGGRPAPAAGRRAR